jgi:integrase
MTVDLMPGTSIYRYRFQLNGVKYHASTETGDKRQADAIEKHAKREAKRQQILSSAQQTGSQMTLKCAVGRYIREQEQKAHIDQATFKNERQAFHWIVSTIGPDVPMADLDLDIVAKMVAERRKCVRKGGNGKPLLDEVGNPRMLANSYINRYTSKLLKRVYFAARDDWNIPVKAIKWSSDKIVLPEGPQRKREIRLEEEDAIIADEDFRAGYGAAFQFALLSGMRKENFTALRWSEVDFGNREITFSMKGKNGGKDHTITIDDEMLAILMAERGKHPTYVFTFFPKRTRLNPTTGKQETAGVRVPLTYWGFTSWYRRLVKRLGFDVTIHDIRRTTGSRIVRRTGDLKAASEHLGHSDISVTAKFYAHVQSGDMLQVLNQTAAATKKAKEALADLLNEKGTA